MKIIDLLNKIAKGEEVPKNIKYIGYIFEYDTNHERYEAYIDGEIYTLGEYVNINDSLNDEAEIIEEEKKIPEKLMPTSLKGIDNLDEKIEISHIDTISAIDKINELIDEVNKLKEK